MKTFITIILLLVFLIGTSTAITKPRTTVKITDNTIETLINGLNTNNIGLQSSSAYMIGELQLSQGVIPLLKILHTEKNEELRIAAALALYKIGSPIAIYAVKQAIRFDDSQRVSKHCADFYNDYLRNKLNDEEINADVTQTALK